MVSTVHIRRLSDLAVMIAAVEHHLREEVMPSIGHMLGPKVVEAIRDRIFDSRFGTNSVGERGGKGSEMNSDYTLYGEDDEAGDWEGHRFEDRDNYNDDNLRRSIYKQDDDFIGKELRGMGDKPLMETKQYVNAFAYTLQRKGAVWKLHPVNEVGEAQVDDHHELGPPLWNVHEYGYMDSPPRPHIWPGMRDALKASRLVIEAMLQREVNSFLRNHVVVEAIHV